MPDKNPNLARLLAVLMVIVTLLSAISLVAIWVGASYANSASKSSKSAAIAVSSLRQSSLRSECRFEIINNDEDLFRHRIGEILKDAALKEQEQTLAIVDMIRNEVPTQDKIVKQCPEPISGKGSVTTESIP